MNLTTKAQVWMLKAIYEAFRLFLEFVRLSIWPRRKPSQVERVCIYRIGNIGDVICALPAVYAIRQGYPQARLTFLTSPGEGGALGARELLGEADWLDEIFVYNTSEVSGISERLELIRKLRKKKFDIWIELPGSLSYIRTNLRNMFLARLSGARWAYGWRISTIRLAAQVQSEYFQFPNEVERCLAIVKETGIHVSEVVFPLPLKTHHIRAIDQIFERHSLAGVSCVAVAPGGKRSTNRWPAERFGMVAKHLVDRGLRVILLGGKSDVEICERIAEMAGKKAVNLAGQTSLLESCELLKRCMLLVCNDSGVQHMAAAVGTPCVSLFSSRDLWGKWWPHGAKNAVIQKWVECHTCFLETCPFDNRCIKLIEVDEVINCVNTKIPARNLRG